jgi:hypothetical protein
VRPQALQQIKEIIKEEKDYVMKRKRQYDATSLEAASKDYGNAIKDLFDLERYLGKITLVY